jgi:S-adenosylmethionine:diacylglycerol 3-amino-3-carboxypropyl transferase
MPRNNPWARRAFRGHEPDLLFGYTYEDSANELAAFTGSRRVFCIAGAGCIARALAEAGHEVTAVDINPVQLQYARERAAGSPPRDGRCERFLTRARRLLRLTGWRDTALRAFLELDDPSEQSRVWKSDFETRRWTAAIDAMLSRAVLRLTYASEFLRVLPPYFGCRVRERLRRSWATHPNRTNPFARRLLLGEAQDRALRPLAIEFVCADAAAYLESCPRGRFTAFALSNILDAAPPEYAHRLWRAVRRAATPGSPAISRSFAEPSPGLPNLAPKDRSMLWGSVSCSIV